MNLSNDLVVLVAPILLGQIVFSLYCVLKIRSEGVANLSKGTWYLLVTLGSTFGSLAFLLKGRRRESFD